MKKAIALALFSTALAAGCGGRQNKSFVKVDDVALGRVVVYRNGVAFYERRALVKGGKLTVVVPRERVDDFLKSLTVVDAKTKDPLPVTFPRDQGDYGQYVEMSLEVPTDEAEVVLTYVTESPAWKPSYRLVVGEKGRVMLEAWAIVDNTSGEDWKQVILGVGSSSALSFRYDLWSVRTVQRETLSADNSFAVAPPIAQSTYTQQPAGEENVVVVMDDAEIRRPEGHPDYVEQNAPAPAADYGGDYYGGGGESIESSYDDDEDYYDESPKKKGGKRKKEKKAKKAETEKVATDSDSSRIEIGRSTAPPPAPRDTRAPEGDAKVQQLAQQLITNGQTIVVEGYAAPGETDQTSFDRANLVRNQLIDNGVPPAQVRVDNKGIVTGQNAGVKIVQETQDESQNAAVAMYAESDAPPVGESHFVSEKLMDVDRGTSVMASMMREETDGEIAYLFDAESDRGNSKYAFRAVRVENPTDYTLESGPVTVYGDNRVVGEGVTEPIPPHAKVVIPFALDRQVVVEGSEETENRVSKLMTLERGVLTAEVQHIKKTHLVITSRLRTDSKVYVRHTVGKGWTLIDAPETFERIADAHLFEIDLPAGKTKEVDISEATPMVRTLDLDADPSLEMMKVFVESGDPGPELKAQLEDLLKLHHDMVDGKEKIDSLRRRNAEYRVRMDELHGQIVTLKAVKSGGDLLKHLKAKMKDISNRVQETTIEIVDTEESIMLAKVQFQDALAELHLPDALAPTTGATPTVSGGGGADADASAP